MDAKGACPNSSASGIPNTATDVDLFRKGKTEKERERDGERDSGWRMEDSECSF